MKKRAGGDYRVPLFPEKDPLDEIISSNLRLPRRLWERLDHIADAEDKSRTEVISFFLKWACDDYERAKQARSHKK